MASFGAGPAWWQGYVAINPTAFGIGWLEYPSHRQEPLMPQTELRLASHQDNSVHGCSGVAMEPRQHPCTLWRRKVTRPKCSILTCFASESEPEKHSKLEKCVCNNRCPLDLLWQTSHCVTTPSSPSLLSPSQSSHCSLCSQSLDLFTCTWFYLELNQRLHKNTVLTLNLCLLQTLSPLFLCFGLVL